MRKLIIWTVIAMLLTASSALAARGKSSGGAAPTQSSLTLAWSHGTYDYGEPVTPATDYIATQGGFPEMGLNLEYAKMMAQDYQMAVGFDYRWGSYKSEPTTNAVAGSPTVKITSSSWKLRVGGDRVGEIGSRFKWFFGPGIEYSNGKGKFENVVAAGTVDGPSTSKWGLNGRVGGVMMLNPTMGIKGQVGDSFGMASVSDTGGKDTWYYSTFEAMWGLEWTFGK